jgi:hypothetical protein
MSTPSGSRLLASVRARARRLALWMNHLWQSGLTSPDQGQAIAAAEVERLLAAEAMAEAESAFDEASAAALNAEVEATALELQADPLWRTLCGRFGLAEPEAELLALAVALELDPDLQRVIAYLQDDGRATQATPWLTARLWRRPAAPLFGANLRRWRLAAPVEPAAGGRLNAPWQADAALALAIATGIWRDPALGEIAELIAPAEAQARPCLYPKALEELGRVDDFVGVEVVGAPGSGRRWLAAQCAAALGLPLIAVDLARTPGGQELEAILTRALRDTAMNGALAYFGGADDVPEAEWKRARALGVPFLIGLRRPGSAARCVRLPPLDIGARVGLWKRVSAAPAPPDLLAHRLVAGDIVHAARRPGERPRSLARRPDSALLATLPLPYEWSDLVLPPEVAEQLQAFETQVRLRWPVYEEWNFGRLAHLGHGISALFCGASGTGKTMAAQVIANSLGLELLHVDLAGVVNKYIGETEKKLREVFDVCEDSGAVLFFDEADALFGSRTQVKDAHDRFANIEIDYLLQRIERFDGVAILATNRRHDLDTAFLRRLRFVIDFPAPRAGERLSMWKRALPERAPGGEVIVDDLDWGMLSERLVMTGAQIKSVAIGAAFLAREKGERIGMRHIYTAAQRELSKDGQRVRLHLREAGE